MLENIDSPLEFFGKIIEIAGQKIQKISLEDNKKPSKWGTRLQKIGVNSKIIERLTYEQTIEYFVQQRPQNAPVKKGALLKEDHAKGFQILQIFLDNNDELICQDNGIPYGRKLIVKQLDDELTELFEEKSMIVFQ